MITGQHPVATPCLSRVGCARVSARALSARFRTVGGVSTTTPSSTPDETPSLPAVSLWSIHDVAEFLQRCENTARRVANEADAPSPVLADGAGRLWDPRDWWAWSAARSSAAVKARRTAGRRARKAGTAAGSATHV